MNWLEPVVMQGQFVRLEPLTLDHAVPMFAHYEPRAMTYLPRGQEIRTLEEFTAYIQVALERPNRIYWAVRMLKTDQVAGFVLIAEFKQSDNWLTLGTLIMPAFWGGPANTEAKLLLMTRAFEDLGVTRVQFSVDARNARSMAALEKYGVVREAVLRHASSLNGKLLDLAMYGVIDDDWPAVKQRLEEKVNQ